MSSPVIQVNDIFDQMKTESEELKRRIRVLTEIKNFYENLFSGESLNCEQKRQLSQLCSQLESPEGQSPETKPRLTCDDCHKTFVYSKALQTHKKTSCGQTSREKRLLECPLPDCDFRCATRTRMDDHQNRHTCQTPHSCHVCAKQFAARASLANHVRYVHSAHVFRCVWLGCEFSSKFKHRLLTHEKTHSGEKPFHCDCIEI